MKKIIVTGLCALSAFFAFGGTVFAAEHHETPQTAAFWRKKDKKQEEQAPEVDAPEQTTPQTDASFV